MTCFRGVVILGLTFLPWAIATPVKGAEFKEVVVIDTDLDPGQLVLFKWGIAKWTMTMKVGPSTNVTNAEGKSRSLSEIRPGTQGTIRYVRTSLGEDMADSFVIE